MLQRLLSLFGVLCWLFFAAMGGDLDMGKLISETEATGVLNVYHWWTAGGEKEAIEAAIEVFRSHYPNVRVFSNAVPGGAGGAMVMKVKILMVTGNAPETFQAHPGYEIRPYTDASLLFCLDDLWQYANIANRLLPGIEEFCRIGSNYYAVPIGLHKCNVVWYNKHLFEEYGVRPPEEPVTWEEFWALCDELAAKLPPGKYVLDLGDRQGWTATHVFETIMMGISPQIYENFINGVATVEEIAQVLEMYKKFLKYVAPDHTARLWYETAGEVYAGNVAMYLHGDWIKAYFTSRGWIYGEDYGAFSAPGTSDKFGVCIDTFVVPKTTVGLENGLRWAYFCATPELQLVFTQRKGSISPYREFPPELYDPLTLEFYNQLLNPNTLVYPSFAHGTALPWEVLMDLHSRITDFTTSSDPDVLRYARMIAQSLKEANIQPYWKIVR